MAWLKNFLLKRKLRKLVSAFVGDLQKHYGSSADYTPGQLQTSLRRIRVPAKLVPIMLAGALSKEAFLRVNGSATAESYEGLRLQFRDLLPGEWSGDHWIMTDDHTLRDFDFRNVD